jgi:hypothetical protein
MHAIALLLLLAANVPQGQTDGTDHFAAVNGAYSVDGMVTLDRYPVPGVIVTLSGDRGVKRTAVSDAAGRYHFDGVEGRYQLRAEMAGLRADRRRGNDFELKVDTPVCTQIVADTGRLDGPHTTFIWSTFSRVPYVY